MGEVGELDRYFLGVGDEPEINWIEVDRVEYERHEAHPNSIFKRKITPPVPPAAELRPAELEAQQYMDEHPDVDWGTHEVLYTWNGPDKPMTVDSHWVKPDYEALHAELKRLEEHEQVRFRQAMLGERFVIRTNWFRELYAAQVKLWALEAAGVDSWDGYADAMRDMVDSGDLDAVDTFPEVS